MFVSGIYCQRASRVLDQRYVSDYEVPTSYQNQTSPSLSVRGLVTVSVASPWHFSALTSSFFTCALDAQQHQTFGSAKLGLKSADEYVDPN